MKRCVNIDWLQLYCTSDTYFTLPRLLESRGYVVKLRDQVTRHFRTLYDVYTPSNDRYMEIQCNPYSLKSEGGVWLPSALLVKLCNKYCYEQNAVSKLCDLLMALNVTIRSISRLDLACDLQYFDNGLKPSTLMSRFFDCKYWKLGANEFTTHGKQKQNIVRNYLRFGTGKSAVSVYMYNKSKEMVEVKEKPWIRDAWVSTGYNKGDVWRLELSLKSDAKHMIQYDDVIVKQGDKYYNKTTGEVHTKLSNFSTDFIRSSPLFVYVIMP